MSKIYIDISEILMRLRPVLSESELSALGSELEAADAYRNESERTTAIKVAFAKYPSARRLVHMFANAEDPGLRSTWLGSPDWWARVDSMSPETFETMPSGTVDEAIVRGVLQGTIPPGPLTKAEMVAVFQELRLRNASMEFIDRVLAGFASAATEIQKAMVVAYCRESGWEDEKIAWRLRISPTEYETIVRDFSL